MCAASMRAQVIDIAKITYVRATSFRHSNFEKLTFKKDNSFHIRQKNFRGVQRIKGNWSLSGDTLTLNYLNSGKNVLVKSEILLVKKDCLFDFKSNYERFYTKDAWKAGGKIYEGGL